MPDASLTFDAEPDASIEIEIDASPPPPDAPSPPDAAIDAAPPPPIDAAVDAPPDARPGDASLLPDSRPMDAGPIDARPPAADARCRVELVENGDFDLSTGEGADKEISPWINVIAAGQRTMLVDSAAELQAIGLSTQAGGYAARLGGEDNVAHGLFASFKVPNGTRDLVLTGQFWVSSVDAPQELNDFLKIRILDENGDLLEEIGSLDEGHKSSGYMARTFSTVSPYSNRMLTLALWATTNDSFATEFLVDSLKLEAIFCQ